MTTDTYGLTADDWSQLESAQAEARKVRADHPKLTQGDAVKSILTARFAAHELRLRSFDRIMRYLDNDTAHDRIRALVATGALSDVERLAIAHLLLTGLTDDVAEVVETDRRRIGEVLTAINEGTI